MYSLIGACSSFRHVSHSYNHASFTAGILIFLATRVGFFSDGFAVFVVGLEVLNGFFVGFLVCGLRTVLAVGLIVTTGKGFRVVGLEVITVIVGLPVLGFVVGNLEVLLVGLAVSGWKPIGFFVGMMARADLIGFAVVG